SQRPRSCPSSQKRVDERQVVANVRKKKRLWTETSLERIEAIVERQQRMPAEGDNQRVLFL
ncbi:hypothetical protein NKH71_32790, partial [Mesorhizobium sp. M0983]|uniref:hypothetical protein n=1 Tax=Mesorhizobium sp. M0983 TaxID=2957040 RepID=UPI00333D1799